jgi:L-malate glycosyltransferase
MKILVASHSYIVDLNREKLRQLAQLDSAIEVTVVVPQRWKPGGVMRDTIVSQPHQEGNFRVVPLSNLSQNNQGLLSFGPDLITLLRQFRPDIIQVEQGSKSLAYAEMIALNRLLGLKAKNCFFTWWNMPYELKFPVAHLEKYNLDHTHGIVVGNAAGYEVLRDRGYSGPMQVMPQLGVDERIFRPQPQPELRASLGIAANEFVIGYVGRFVPEKGLINLLNACAGLADRSYKLLFLGRGPQQAELVSRAEELGIADRLTIIDSVPHAEVPRYISAMDTLVLPSETTYAFKTLTAAGWQEQFGHVLIEAMAAQVPVIGSDSGEIPNVIGAAGLVFTEGSAAELRGRLTQLMDHPILRRSLAEHGYQRAMAKYTNRALAQELLGFYRSLGEV